jgi:hypothetical protein
MFEQCGGRYSIAREWDENGETVTSSFATANGNSSVSGHGYSASGNSSATASGFAYTATQKYRVIDFRCERSTLAQ